MERAHDLELAFVIHMQPFRNTSLLCYLLTQAYGRISVIAKGARTAKSKYRGNLRQFVPLLVGLSGKSDLRTLTQVEPSGLSISLSGKALLCGLYINELISRLLTTYDPFPDLFEAYLETLKELSHGEDLELHLRIFEKTLLQEIGYGLPLEYEANTNEPINPAQDYHLYPGEGFLPIRQNTKVHEKRLAIFPGKHLLMFANNELNDKNVLRDAKRITRITLQNLLGHKPLYSRLLFQEVAT